MESRPDPVPVSPKVDEIVGRLLDAISNAQITDAEIASVALMDAATFSKIRHGKRRLSTLELALICEHLHIAPSLILFGQQPLEENAMTEATTEPSPFDFAYYEASKLTLTTLTPGVEYTLVRNADNSDAGRVECFFTDESAASRYVTRLKAAFAAGTLGEHFHPAPLALDIAVYSVSRRV